MKVASANDAVNPDQSVKVKVVAIDQEKKKIALSLKYVDQNTGKDKDPTGNKFESENARRGGGTGGASGGCAGRSGRGIELGAVHNTICARCGGRGHMEADCLVAKSSKYGRASAYEQIDEPEEPEPESIVPTSNIVLKSGMLDNFGAQAAATFAASANATDRKRERERSPSPISSVAEAKRILDLAMREKAAKKAKKEAKKAAKKDHKKEKKKEKKVQYLHPLYETPSFTTLLLYVMHVLSWQSKKDKVKRAAATRRIVYEYGDVRFAFIVEKRKEEIKAFRFRFIIRLRLVRSCRFLLLN
jgi:predicted RNA-binding protein with RPS1 domain